MNANRIVVAACNSVRVCVCVCVKTKINGPVYSLISLLFPATALHCGCIQIECHKAAEQQLQPGPQKVHAPTQSTLVARLQQM